MTTPKTTLAVTGATAAALILFGAVVHSFKTITATASWQPTVSDSYRLYSGAQPGTYTATLNAGTTGNYNFIVVRGATYYFAMSAIRNGIESKKSLEYKYTAPK